MMFLCDTCKQTLYYESLEGECVGCARNVCDECAEVDDVDPGDSEHRGGYTLRCHECIADDARSRKKENAA